MEDQNRIRFTNIFNNKDIKGKFKLKNNPLKNKVGAQPPVDSFNNFGNIVIV